MHGIIVWLCDPVSVTFDSRTLYANQFMVDSMTARHGQLISPPLPCLTAEVPLNCIFFSIIKAFTVVF